MRKYSIVIVLVTFAVLVLFSYFVIEHLQSCFLIIAAVASWMIIPYAVGEWYDNMVNDYDDCRSVSKYERRIKALEDEISKLKNK